MVQLYRVGSLIPAKNYGVATDAFRDCDLYKPFGRQGRFGALYCVPTLKDMAVWLDGYDGTKTDAVYELWEVTVDDMWLNQIYAYPLSAWSTCRQLNIDFKNAYKAFWASGIPLGNWAGVDASESFWEVLVPSGMVSSVRPVEPLELLKAVQQDGNSTDIIIDKYKIVL